MFPKLDTRGHGERAYFGSTFQSVRDVSDERAGLCPYLATLYAEAPINAVGTVAMRAREDGYGTANGDGDVQRRTALNERVAHTTHRVRPIRIAMWMSPRIVGWACDGHFEFELFIVGADNFVAEGPVNPDAVAGVDLEV